MANSKSALKRIKIAERNRVSNKAYKSAVRTLMKKYFAALDDYARQPSPESLEEVRTRMAAAYSKIDKAVKRGVLHTNNAARKKSRLAKWLKRIDDQQTTSSQEAVAS
ncbi:MULTISPECIES: 30S ribosomal protein S20 [unclassified Coleofasciculus]|uniref:30S ribosomal protein S20 n=1 Tax=unclassified Coleofasciculus TaxID=2692782 RepID=UPI001882593E|nr:MULTISPECIES: 30S ribosomal protein S20 [unclassified Coleofasciculus]MBE9127954.1 30S ribosomal protein S20 [Coleofasciculus sp. LEGE 07081]MBE9151113.1 30S ribosomal protein S20 [Coleofasciculus sp. LEGE 07092]